MKDMKTALRKFQSRRGESISEVLTAVLITTLGLTILAGMISGASRVIRRSEDAMGRYIAAENALAEQSEASPNQSAGQATLTFGNAVDEKKITVDVTVYSAETGEEQPLYSYEAKE